MSYKIEAIISNTNISHQLFNRLKEATVLVPLNNDLIMIPLTVKAFEIIKEVDEDEEEIIISGTEYLTPKLFGILMRFSSLNSIAYIEAEYFGGEGSQSAILWNNCEVIFESLNKDNAINEALRLLNIEKKDSFDEFDTIGLGRFRNTEDWIRSGAST